MSAGLALLWLSDEMWIFGDTVTSGMQNEIQFCKNLNIRVRNVPDEEIMKVIGGKKYD